MPNPYIPAQDSAYDNWAANFSAQITASPATYGLVAGDATAIATAFSNWHAAYLLAGLTAPPNPTPVNPSTRTSVTIAAKDVQKAASAITFRSYAMIIGANAGVSSGAKIAAGLTDRATGRTPIPAPGTAPILGFIGATPGVHTLKYSDTSTPTTKAKPFGAIQIELWNFVAIVPPVGGALGCSFVGVFTKTPFSVNYLAGDIGKNAYYYGRWTTRRGIVGPWSAVLIAAIV